MLEVILFIVLTGCLIGLSLFFLAWSKQNSGQGKRFSTPQEIAQREREIVQQAREIAQRERQIADRERERAQKLAAKLRELGVDPDEL
jgi:cell division protein FtsL